MPIRPFEKEILQLLAQHRSPESFVGGATVLNQAPDTPRSSEDIDLFHDTETALEASLSLDIPVLETKGMTVEVLFRAPSFCRAVVRRGDQATKLEWVYDSAFRFFPIEADQELGFKLNYWDAATNKVLAGVGRGVIRDYVDLIHLHQTGISLGALIWAAAGKDPGLSPHFICGELSRSHRYSAGEYASLQMNNVDPEGMKRIWRQSLLEADVLFDTVLAKAPLGCFFLDSLGKPNRKRPQWHPCPR